MSSETTSHAARDDELAADRHLRTAVETPALAPDVHLHGEMPDVGFTTKQWLVERNGQFLQVSELLYRVLEQIDGTRTHAEIASAVTAASEWALEAEHVQHLLEKKLRPLGVLAGTAAVAPVSPSPAALAPLRLHMRMRMMPAWFVEGLTTVLQYAYAPALLIPVAALIALAHWWLYSARGYEAGVQSALYEPGAMGAVLLLTIGAGLFHELGHSSALRYGGGRPRGIGFGFYLMFPAFYSDVTDSYRLGRGSRIRTDLGGIYFHLIFAAGLIGLAAWTGNDFLVAAALLFNVEAARQLIPFIRLDGYWLLADLTGVPDFLSQVRSLAATARARSGARANVPLFKTWVAVVFAAYLLLSIPLTVYLVGLMVSYLPTLWTLTQHALVVQTQLWSAVPEPLTRVLIVTQIVLLPLPLVATSYLLYVTFSSLAAQLGARAGWSAPAYPVRRLAGATAFAAASAFVISAWGPGAGSSNAAAAVDSAALLDSVRHATARVQTLHAEVSGSLDDERVTGTIVLRRPNHARIDVNGAADSLGTFHVISDGAKVFVYFPHDNSYTEAKAAADGGNINAFMIDQVRVFFRPERLAPGKGQHLSYAGRELLEDGAYDVLELKDVRADRPTWRYYVAPHDHLVRRVSMTRVIGGKSSVRVMHLSNVTINAPVEEGRFRWTPPKDATPLNLEMFGLSAPQGPAQ